MRKPNDNNGHRWSFIGKLPYYWYCIKCDKPITGPSVKDCCTVSNKEYKLKILLR